MGPVAGVLLALGAGLVAWVLFTIIPDTWRPARWPATIVAMIMGAMNGCTHFADVPLPTERVERELLESERVGELARAFRERDPSAFARYVADLEQASRLGPESQAMARAAITLQTAAEPRIAFLPDEDVAAYFALLRDEMLEIRDLDPAACHAFFHGTSVAALPTSEALSLRRLALYAKAFRADGTFVHQRWSESDWALALREIQDRTAEVVGADIQLLASDATIEGREARSCEVIAELYRQISVSAHPGRVFVTMRPAI